jgi:hypothetical protein
MLSRVSSRAGQSGSTSGDSFVVPVKDFRTALLSWRLTVLRLGKCLQASLASREDGGAWRPESVDEMTMPSWRNFHHIDQQ